MLLMTALLALAFHQGFAESSSPGKVFAQPSVLPGPKAFFPMTEGSGNEVQTYAPEDPNTAFTGSINSSIGWKTDSVFGRVVVCDAGNQDSIRIEPIDYGTSGNFTINLWVVAQKNSSDKSGVFGYIYSSSSTADSGNFSAFDPSSVQIYTPQANNANEGMLRVIVKDSTDSDLTSFVDADGHYNDPSILDRIYQSISDGMWHMVTVVASSQGEGLGGYQVYIDSLLHAQVPSPKSFSFGDGISAADGGRTLGLQNSSIYLCSRADQGLDTHFSGSVAHLSLFDEALSPDDLQLLFRSVPLSAALADVPERLTVTGTKCNFPFQLTTSLLQYDCVMLPYANASFCEDVHGDVLECASLETATDFGQFQSWLDSFSVHPSVQSDNGTVQLCALNGSSPVAQSWQCNDGFVCGPLSAYEINHFSNKQDELLAVWGDQFIGVCAANLSIYMANPVTTDVPVPQYYYPLAAYQLSSWPVPSSWFWNDSSKPGTQANWVEDVQFGSVVDCQKDQGDYLSISNTPFGQSGPFAVNVWIKQNSSDDAGQMLDYVFSTSSKDNFLLNQTTMFDSNQVHMFLPDEDHPAHDLVRVIVKDSNDSSEGLGDDSFLDSDNTVGSNSNRSTSRLDLKDGQWHMLTVTTLMGAPAQKGFEIFVDGIFQAGQYIDGGMPMEVMPPTIVLCGRADHAEGRFFNGQLTQLSIFNASLSADAVTILYSLVMGMPMPASTEQSGLFGPIPDGNVSEGIFTPTQPGIDTNWSSQMSDLGVPGTQPPMLKADDSAASEIHRENSTPSKEHTRIGKVASAAIIIVCLFIALIVAGIVARTVKGRRALSSPAFRPRSYAQFSNSNVTDSLPPLPEVLKPSTNEVHALETEAAPSGGSHAKSSAE